MSDPSFNIRHGQLHDVTGRPVRFEETTFVPASVSVLGDAFNGTHHLREHLLGISDVAMRYVPQDYDAPWTLGRMLFLFGTHLLGDIDEFRSDKFCFIQGFLAVFHDRENLSIPFFCGDRYCESALKLSDEDPPEPPIQHRVSRDFWSLLLSDPAQLEDYECGMLHSDVGNGRIKFGVRLGEPFLVDTST